MTEQQLRKEQWAVKQRDMLQPTSPFFPDRLYTVDGGESRYRVQLVKSFRYVTEAETILVQPEFYTDFASVPQIAQNIYPPTGPYRFAAVIHDWLYFIGDRPKNDCDAVFREAMRHTPCPVSTWQRETMYAAVLAGGWVAWNRYRAV